MNTDFYIQDGVRALECALEALEELTTLKTITASTQDKETLSMAVLSLEALSEKYELNALPMSLEDAQQKPGFSERINRLIDEVWKAVIRFLKWVMRYFETFYQSFKFDSVFQGFEHTRALFNEGKKKGIFKAPKDTKLFSQRVFTRLNISQKVEFNALMSSVSYLNVLSDKLERYLQREVRKLSSFNLTAVITNIENEKDYELPILSLFSETRNEVNTNLLTALGFDAQYKGYQSRVLPSNKIVFFLYSEDTDFKHFVDSKHGLYLLDLPNGSEATKTQSVVEVLNEQQMFQLLMLTQGLVNTTKENWTSFTEVQRVLEKLISSFSRVKAESIKQEDAKLIKNSLTSTCRSLGTIGVEYVQYSVRVIEACSSYLRASMEKYK